jgi:hypothetical protein
MTNETAVREAFHDLTTGQPTAPVDRFRGVQRRHLRRRTTQFGTVAALVALVAVGATLIPSPLKNVIEPAHKVAPSWVIPWPARYDGRISARAAAATQSAALRYYQRTEGLTVRDPRTLYVGTPDGTEVQWVVVEAPSHTGAAPDGQLIALASPDHGVSWTPYVSAAPPASTGALGFVWDSAATGHRVFLLGPPKAQQVILGYLPTNVVAYGGWQLVTDGVGVSHIPPHTRPGEVYVGAVDPGSTFPAFFPEGTISGPVRLLPWQTALKAAPSGGRRLTFQAGTGSQGGFTTVPVPRNGTLTVSISCVGPAPVRLIVDDGNRQARSATNACNGSAGPVEGQETLLVHQGDRLEVSVVAGAFTYYAVGVYLV